MHDLLLLICQLVLVCWKQVEPKIENELVEELLVLARLRVIMVLAVVIAKDRDDQRIWELLSQVLNKI